MDIGDLRLDCKGLEIVDLSSVSLELNEICCHFLGSWDMKKSNNAFLFQKHIASIVICLVKKVENLLRMAGIIGKWELNHLANMSLQLYTSLLKRNTACSWKMVQKLDYNLMYDLFVQVSNLFM